MQNNREIEGLDISPEFDLDQMAREAGPISDQENADFFGDLDDDLIPDDDCYDYSTGSDDDDFNIEQPGSFISKLREIEAAGTPLRYDFRNYSSDMIDVQAAKKALGIYDKLNTDNQSVFQYIGSGSPNMLSQLLSQFN